MKFFSTKVVQSILLFLILACAGYLSSFALLKIDIESENDDTLEIFWADEWSGFTVEQSKSVLLDIGRHSYWVVTNDFNKYKHFRIDPVTQQTTFKLYKLELYSLLNLPIHIDFLYDSISAHEIKVLQLPSETKPYTEIVSVGNDPQIEIRPLQKRSFLLEALVLVLICGFLLRKKKGIYVVLMFVALGFLYAMLSLNDTKVSFQVDAKEAGQVKVFWRDNNEKFSLTRQRNVTTQPGKHQYSIDIGNFNNASVLYLEKTSLGVPYDIDNISVTEPGFVSFNTSEMESIVAKEGDKRSLAYTVLVFITLYVLLMWAIYVLLKGSRFNYFLLFPGLYRGLFLLALLLVFTLAWQADFNLHPDEHAHIESTKYYSQFWDPPLVGDPRALDAYQAPWANSRLDDLGISYFLAGKFRNFTHYFFAHEDFIARAFNAFLFTLFFIISGNRRALLFLVPLLCSPQIWYLFSYTNRGAFVLFVSVLMAWQLANKKSALNTFLSPQKKQADWKHVLYPGLLLGIISIEQTNYILFIMFVFAILLWELLFFSQQKKLFAYKCLIFFGIAMSLFLLRYGVDVSLNGFDKLSQRVAYAEQHAAPGFKPSLAATEGSYPGLRLREKGVAFMEIFNSDWEWHKMSFKSFSGFYGYYAEYSPRWYYAYVLIIYVFAFLVMLKHALLYDDWRYKLFTLITFTALAGGVLMSILLSWLYDFQPQGRYMFPVLPILLVYFWKMYPRWKRPEQAMLLASMLLLIVLSFYSFNEVALNYLVS